MIKKLKTLEQIKKEFQCKENMAHIFMIYRGESLAIVISPEMRKYFGKLIEVKENGIYYGCSERNIKQYSAHGWIWIDIWFRPDEFFIEEEFMI